MFNARIRKELKILAFAAAAGLCLTGLIASLTYVYSETTQADIARHVFRFHVRANSDSEADQQLKQAVRDTILETFKEELNASRSAEETRLFLTDKLGEIEACARSAVQAHGFDYPVSASVGREYFPTRAYGDVVLPPGRYETLLAEIGAGAGQNWWCVMFPPLCYVDATRGFISENGKKQLESDLSKEEYQLLTYESREQTVKIKFKVVEWWQNRKHSYEVANGRAAKGDVKQ